MKQVFWTGVFIGASLGAAIINAGNGRLRGTVLGLLAAALGYVLGAKGKLR